MKKLSLREMSFLLKVTMSRDKGQDSFHSTST